jgi:hypothetical protein
MDPKTSMWVGAALALLATASTTEADSPSYRTSWTFRVVFPAANVETKFTPDNAPSQLTMPVGSPWRCSYDVPAMTPDRRLQAGFSCQTSGAYMSLPVLCQATQFDSQDSMALLGGAVEGSAVYLFVHCDTTSVPKSTKPIK